MENTRQLSRGTVARNPRGKDGPAHSAGAEGKAGGSDPQLNHEPLQRPHEAEILG
ncbi:hypothetical protein SDC9_162841 [bioreactor metagenome]|uniref:Uncharacterized protein n=1 Tax=bioreactor metagenome TaxID=1076179 RepID=A0A645FM66_9ZZZZ